MTEERVGFLYNIASNLPQENKSLKILRSYYLMRCNQLTKGYGLPRQHFSSKVRCSHCCLEWSKDFEVKTQSIKLSKKQRLRIRTLKSNEQKYKVEKSKALLKSNEMILTCGFCNKVTTTKLIKPEKAYIKMVSSNKKDDMVKGNNKKKPELNKSQKSEIKKAQSINTKSKLKQNATTVNVYSNTLDVFSLKNEKNTLLSTIKEPVKVNKNKKKKKDKFAGLCEKAVLASAKLKQNEKKLQEQHSTSKLSFFLKLSD